MSEYPLNTPVLFLIFNRPDTTQVVFDEIRKAKPAQLFVAADGPRRDRPDDTENCRNVREIIRQVDWDCKVTTLFREENLGCKKAISSAIDWFFSFVEEGIILEDDCVPDQSFFLFCQELLEKYHDDERIMMITGDNLQFGKNGTQDSYYFSHDFLIWGWATWKRAWKYYDVDIKNWPEIHENGYLNNVLSEKRVVKYWESIFESVYRGTTDTWDYQWVFSCWCQGGLSIIPNKNLVSNIGCEYGTHTNGADSVFSKLPAEKITFPLIHPKYIIRNIESERSIEKILLPRPVIVRLIEKIKNL
jgi:hypothetical protein